MKLSYQNEIALNTGAFAMSENTLEDLIEILLNTRDLCGNEAEAMRDWEADNRKLKNAGERAYVLFAVNQRWDYWRKAAGVTKPISTHERAEITRMMEKAP